MAKKVNEGRSGRGQSGGGALSHRIDNPDRRMGLPPKKTRGGPSMSPDVNASKMMQDRGYTEEDKEWEEELFKKRHKKFLKPDTFESLVEFIQTILESDKKIISEPDNKKKRKKKQKKEYNAVSTGAISGYTLPLGASNFRKKNTKINAKNFGNGKVVKKKKK